MDAFRIALTEEP